MLAAVAVIIRLVTEVSLTKVEVLGLSAPLTGA